MKEALIFLAATCIAGVTHADWQYRTDKDKMTGKTAEYATLESNNSLDLPFPYQGRNNGYVWVRRHPKYGTDAIVSVDKGQILCPSYSTCNVSIRFDDAPPVRYTGVGPSDHSSTSFFLNNQKRFIAEAKKAKRILIQFTMYKAGDQVLEFHSSKPLDWADK